VYYNKGAILIPLPLGLPFTSVLAFKTDLVLGAVVIVLHCVTALWRRRCRTKLHRRREIMFPGIRCRLLASAHDGRVAGRREQSKSVARRDADATGVGTQPPADESGDVTLVDSQDVAGREAQFFLGVGGVGVQCPCL